MQKQKEKAILVIKGVVFLCITKGALPVQNIDRYFGVWFMKFCLCAFWSADNTNIFKQQSALSWLFVLKFKTCSFLDPPTC